MPGTNSEMSSSAKDGRQQPERNIVHAREGHVRRADHERHHPVAEAADHRRHDHEKDHDEAMRGDEDVEDLGSPKICMPGYMSSARMPIDRMPPITPPTMAKIRYIVPMSLWLVE